MFTTADGSGSFSSVIPLNLNANNILVVTIVDQAGNTASGTVSVLEDNTAPSVAIATLPQTVHSPTIVLDGTTENDSTLVVTNASGTIVGTGTANASGTWNISTTLVPDIANVLTVTATDIAGNTGSNSVTITEDSTPNTLIISTPAQTLNADNITITGSTKANSSISIAGGVVTATGTADGAGLYSLVVGLTQDANNNLTVTSTDIVNNVLTGSVLIVEDSTNPVTVISTPAQTTYNPIITLSGTTEALATVVVTGGSGTTQTVADGSGVWTLPVDLTLSSLNTLVATATDLAGNSGSASVQITHDSVPVFLTLSVPDQTIHAATFTFTGNTKSGATVTITSLSGSSTFVATGDFTGTVNLVPDTANLVTVTAQDATLATASGSFTITEDSTAPVLAFVSPSGTTTALSNAVLDGTTDPLAQISVNNSGAVILGTASASGTFSITVPLNLNTLNTLDVTATDLVGNVGTGTWTIIQDSSAPIISNLIVSPTVVGPSMIANYSFNTNENSTGTISIGTGANVLATLVTTGITFGTSHNSLVSGLLANTDYYYVVTATDTVGNSVNSTVGIINSVDTVPPTITNVSVSHITTTGATLDTTFTESNFNTAYATGSVTVTTNTGVLVGTYPMTFTLGLNSLATALIAGLSSGNSYNYMVQLTDTYGNSSIATGTFSTPIIAPING